MPLVWHWRMDFIWLNIYLHAADIEHLLSIIGQYVNLLPTTVPERMQAFSSNSLWDYTPSCDKLAEEVKNIYIFFSHIWRQEKKSHELKLIYHIYLLIQSLILHKTS